MTRRDSRHCPQFLDSGNSSEFSISGGPVCSKARDSVLYEQSFLAGFPLFKQRGINYPPTFVGFETKFCFKCLPIRLSYHKTGSTLSSFKVDRAVFFIEIKDFFILWTYSQQRQSLVFAPVCFKAELTEACSTFPSLEREGDHPPRRMVESRTLYVRA